MATKPKAISIFTRYLDAAAFCRMRGINPARIKRVSHWKFQVAF